MARGNNNVANMLVSVTAGGVEYGSNASYATNTGTAANTPGDWTSMTVGQPAFSGTTNAGALYMDLTNIQVTDGTLTLAINGTRDGNANNAALTWIARTGPGTGHLRFVRAGLRHTAAEAPALIKSSFRLQNRRRHSSAVFHFPEPSFFFNPSPSIH